MEFLESTGKYILRIQRGEEIVETITTFLTKQKIAAGTISGIGAADHVKLRYYSLEDKQYHGKEFNGEFEIASLTGNISLLDGKIWPHLHIVLAGTDYQAFGGHLESAVVSVTCEVVINPMSGSLTREFDKETGLQLLSF